MASEHPTRYLVAHALRVKSSADAASVARATGIALDQVEQQLAELERDGLAVRRQGLLPGWSLTSSGRSLHARAIREELIAHGARPAVEGAHRAFLTLNGELLELCTAWQLRPGDGANEPNDHTDAAYDTDVVERLGGIHRRVEPVLDDLESALPQFRQYRTRLSHARERVADGDVDWFTRPTVDSYHTVWFELHEDLLRTLGLERGEERAEAPGGRPDETEMA